MTKKTVKKTVKVPKKFTYILSITTSDETYTVKTNDVHQGLRDYTPPAILKTKTLFTLKKGKNVRQRALNIVDARRVFANQTALQLLSDSLVKVL